MHLKAEGSLLPRMLQLTVDHYPSMARHLHRETLRRRRVWKITHEVRLRSSLLSIPRKMPVFLVEYSCSNVKGGKTYHALARRT